MPWTVKQNDSRWCVYKKGEDTPVPGGCHDSRDEAVRHQRALYAAENSSGSMKYSIVAFSDDLFEDSEDENTKWVKAWRYSAWDHPKYGKIEVNPALGQKFKQHLQDRTLGREHLVNYDHGADAAKGGKAGGTVLDIDPRDDGIYYKVKFTDNALQEIRAGEWKYLSPEFDDWYNPETGELFEDVPFDLALTNTPFFKGMPPLNFSEIFDEKKPPDKSAPKSTKGGKAVDELLLKFAQKLGIDLEEDSTEEAVLKAAEELNETIEPLRRAKVEGARQRTFREAFPDEYKKMRELEATKIESEAESFADSYARFTIKDGDNRWKSTFGFSQLVIDEIAATHRKFSEKTASHADLKKLLDLIGDKGIVDYSESGSSRAADGKPRSEDPKLAFSEAVQEVMENDELEYEAAIHMASIKFPDLYDAYLRAVPQR